MSCDIFLKTCSQILNSDDLESLRQSTIDNFVPQRPNTVFGKWQQWETDLRNQLIVLRCQKLKLDPKRFIRTSMSLAPENLTFRGPASSRIRKKNPDSAGPTMWANKEFILISQSVKEAFAASNPLETESFLHRIRWAYLDDMEKIVFVRLEHPHYLLSQTPAYRKTEKTKIGTGHENS